MEAKELEEIMTPVLKGLFREALRKECLRQIIGEPFAWAKGPEFRVAMAEAITKKKTGKEQV